MRRRMAAEANERGVGGVARARVQANTVFVANRAQSVKTSTHIHIKLIAHCLID